MAPFKHQITYTIRVGMGRSYRSYRSYQITKNTQVISGVVSVFCVAPCGIQVIVLKKSAGLTGAQNRHPLGTSDPLRILAPELALHAQEWLPEISLR